MSCYCPLKESNPLGRSTSDVNAFLCLNKNKIINSELLMAALFSQYKNYLYKSARSVASRYPSIEIEELISEGFEGILRALEKYECSESSFLTYAQHWVRMKMVSAARKTVGIMVLPGSVYSIMNKIRLAQNENPGFTHEEIAEEIGVPVEKITKILQILRTPKFACIDSLEEFVTYEENVGADSGNDSILARNSEEDCSEHLFKERFWTILEEELTTKESFVLGLLFGRGGEMRRSLEWVAKVLGVSKERIRQIKEVAFNKLRASGKLLAFTGLEG